MTWYSANGYPEFPRNFEAAPFAVCCRGEVRVIPNQTPGGDGVSTCKNVTPELIVVILTSRASFVGRLSLIGDVSPLMPKGGCYDEAISSHHNCGARFLAGVGG